MYSNGVRAFPLGLRDELERPRVAAVVGLEADVGRVRVNLLPPGVELLLADGVLVLVVVWHLLRNGDVLDEKPVHHCTPVQHELWPDRVVSRKRSDSS